MFIELPKGILPKLELINYFYFIAILLEGSVGNDGGPGRLRPCGLIGFRHLDFFVTFCIKTKSKEINN
jgi:hypothetical protein